MRISFCILSLFVFLTLSVTAYLIFTTLVPIYSLKTKNKKIFFVWIFVLVFSAYHYSQTHSSLAEGTDLIRNKASVASSTINFLEGIYKTNNFLTPGFGSYFQGGFPGIIPYISFYLIEAFTVITSIILIFSKRNFWFVGFMGLYVSIHFLKGMGPIIVFWPYFIFCNWLICSALSKIQGSYLTLPFKQK